LQEIAENLHRFELTVLERDTQIGRWAELTAVKASQVETPLGGTQPSEKGVRKVANDLGLDKSDVLRAVKVASISPEAKQAARDAGLDRSFRLV
jgi:ParB family chromosome partitioning protein